MIQLLSYPAAFGLPTGTPFGLKAMMLLNMSGKPWQFTPVSDPRKMPHQKLPVINVSGTTVHDSDRIRDYLEAQGADFNAGLSPRDVALSRAVVRMAEEHLYFQVLFDRWANPAVWPAVRDVIFKDIPNPIRRLVAGAMRKTTLRGLHSQGIGRFTADERMAKAEHDLQAITDLVAGGGYLFGDAPTAADASVAPMLASMLVTPVETRLQQRVANDTVLTAYVARARLLMATSATG